MDKTRLSTVLIEVIISCQMLIAVLKVNWTRFKLNVQNLIFTILMFKMINMGTFNAFSNFKSQILSFRPDREFENIGL